MDAQTFWNVIGKYNHDTKAIQIGLLLFIALSISLSFVQRQGWMAKFALGIVNLFIGLVFFGVYGTEPIQKYFALPLYLASGAIFLYESRHSRSDTLHKPNFYQALLLFLFLFYPFASVLLGNSFPQMVTHIMPCPIISLSITVYSGYNRKNKLLLFLLTVWGLTGIKSIIFNAYEDIILLICGLYGIILLAKEIRKSRSV